MMRSPFVVLSGVLAFACGTAVEDAPPPVPVTITQCVLFELDALSCDAYIRNASCEGLFLVFAEDVPIGNHLGAVPADQPDTPFDDDLILRRTRYHRPIGSHGGHSYFFTESALGTLIAEREIRFRLAELGHLTHVSQPLTVGVDCEVRYNTGVPTTQNHPRWMGGEYAYAPLAFGEETMCAPDALRVEEFTVTSTGSGRDQWATITYEQGALGPMVSFDGTTYDFTNGDEPGGGVWQMGFGPDDPRTALQIRRDGTFTIGAHAYNLACGAVGIDVACGDRSKRLTVHFDGTENFSRWFARAIVTADSCRVTTGEFSE